MQNISGKFGPSKNIGILILPPSDDGERNLSAVLLGKKVHGREGKTTSFRRVCFDKIFPCGV